jgi:hypothetical protein
VPVVTPAAQRCSDGEPGYLTTVNDLVMVALELLPA